MILALFAFTANAASEIPHHLLPQSAFAKPKAHTKGHSGHGGHGPRKPKMYKLVGLTDSDQVKLTYTIANLDEKTPKMQDGMMALPESKFESYQALSANIINGNNEYTAVTYIYKHGMPCRTSPEELTAKDKGALEIVPNRLPREHDKYKGSKTYRFDLFSKRQLLANHKVLLTTLNGTSQTFKSDSKGVLMVTLPNDFKNVKTGSRANKPSYFILSSEITEGDKTYHTTLSEPYYVNPIDYWQSIPAAIIVVIVGFIFGLFLYRRSKNG